MKRASTRWLSSHSFEGEDEGVREGVGDNDIDAVLDGVCDVEADDDAVCDALDVGDAVCDALDVGDAVSDVLAVSLCDAVSEGVCD